MYLRLLVTVATAILALSLAGFAQSSTPEALSPSGKHYGKTYGGWSAAWWQWALSTPVHAPPFGDNVNHPLVDLTGAKCGVGQSGPVWFLGGAFVEAGTSGTAMVVRDQCAVPKGKALFFPLLNNECTGVEGPLNGCGATVEESRQIVSSLMDLAGNLAADVDGTAIPISSEFRVGAADKPSFCVTLPPDDLLSFIGEGPAGYLSGTHFSPGTSCGTVDDGYYLMLAPLSGGLHTVHFHGEIPLYGFTLDVIYHLTISP
jgi:hypothetical protein